jgi:hypothetical protein
LNWQGGNPKGLGEELTMEGYEVLPPLLELIFDPHEPQNFASGLSEAPQFGHDISISFGKTN